VKETVSNSSSMCHTTTEITGKVVHNTIRARVSSCVYTSCDEWELDQERRCTPIREIDSDIIGVELMSVSTEVSTGSSLVDRTLGIGSSVGPTSTIAGITTLVKNGTVNRSSDESQKSDEFELHDDREGLG